METQQHDDPKAPEEADPLENAEQTEDPAAAADAEPEGEAPVPSETKDAAPTYEELQLQVADLNDKLLRALADGENIRRRAERDKQDASKYAISNFAREMLSVSDNLRRALDSIDAETRQNTPAVENLMVGVEMTERELLSAMERSGIKRLDPLGEKFNSNFHEAMFEIPDPSQPAGTVAQVVEVGYVLNDRLLRAAKVGVTKGGPKAAAAPAKAKPDAAEERPANDGRKAYEQGAATGSNLDQEL